LKVPKKETRAGGGTWTDALRSIKEKKTVVVDRPIRRSVRLRGTEKNDR